MFIIVPPNLGHIIWGFIVIIHFLIHSIISSRLKIFFKISIYLSPGEVYSNKQLVFRTQQHIFVLGQGGFGGPRNSQHSVNVESPPKRAPDAVVEQKTAEDQAALYR